MHSASPWHKPNPCSRPTAVNLMDGANKLAAAAAAAAGAPGASPASVVEAVVRAAEAYFEEDLSCNRVSVVVVVVIIH